MTSDVVSKRVITANEFIYEQSVSSRMIRGIDSLSLHLAELDTLGREKTRTMIVNGQVAYHEALFYNQMNLIKERRLTLLGRKLQNIRP